MTDAAIHGSGMGTATKTATSPSVGLTMGTARANTRVQTWALAGNAAAKGAFQKGAVTIPHRNGRLPRA